MHFSVGGTAVQPARVTVDHVLPQSAGGTHDISNLVAACYACNEARGRGYSSRDDDPRWRASGPLPCYVDELTEGWEP